MKRIAVIMAMEGEYALVSELLGESRKAVIGDKMITLSLSGIGKVNAAIAATQLIVSEKPDALISTGVAGSVDPSLKALDLVVASGVAYHDVWCGMGTEMGQVQGYPRIFEADASLYDKAMSLNLEDIHRRSGLIISGDRFVEGEDIPGLKKLYPEAIAVDMESGALAQTCHRFGVPFLSFRIISDSGSESSYHDFWKNASASSFKMLKSFLESL